MTACRNPDHYPQPDGPGEMDAHLHSAGPVVLAGGVPAVVAASPCHRDGAQAALGARADVDTAEALDGAPEGLQAPFPYFGGKSRIAALCWQRFGADVANYVEPFCGSAAMLLGRPGGAQGVETINDADGFVANFWRAVRAAADEVAEYADWPVNENDLHARHIWLVGQRAGLTERLQGDPEWYDARAAGWWAWGLSCWIGGGWCAGDGPWRSVGGRMTLAGPEGQGVQRKRPHLNAGRGVHRKRGRDLALWMRALAERLRRVRVCSGDWRRVLGPTPTLHQGTTAVFLDPPYAQAGRTKDIYAQEMETAQAVRDWAAEHGRDRRFRIALCGYEGEHDLPGWEPVRWKAHGGYGNQGDGQGRENARREMVWFSPGCLAAAQGVLL